MALLDGKAAIVTGGSSGIGLATARRFVEEGAYVFITGRRQEALDAAVAELGENVTAVQGDVSDLADIDRLYAVVADSGRKIDVVFANAGIADIAPLEGATEEHVDRLLSTNFKGVLFTVQKALPYLSDGASIILNSSNVASRGGEALGVYAAIKAALRSFARTWANELRSRGIRVNVVSPGATDTPGVEGLAGQINPGPDGVDQFKEFQSAAVPLGRLGEPREVANAVVFLASGLSSFTTGAEIPVDGGINAI